MSPGLAVACGGRSASAAYRALGGTDEARMAGQRIGLLRQRPLGGVLVGFSHVTDTRLARLSGFNVHFTCPCVLKTLPVGSYLFTAGRACSGSSGTYGFPTEEPLPALQAGTKEI